MPLTTIQSCEYELCPVTIEDLAQAASVAVLPVAWQAAEQKGSSLMSQAVHLHLTPRAKTSYLTALNFALASDNDLSSTFY